MFVLLLAVSSLPLLWLIWWRLRLRPQPSLDPPSSGSDSPSSSIPTPGSSSSSGRYRYKVFLSFRGKDTRDNFLGHLYKELRVKGIHTFKDDPALKRGDSISPALLDAISGSAVSVVVLSENYASSSWCLDELVHIMECRRNNGQVVIPIFHKVDPSDVKKQMGSFGNALRAHLEGVKRKQNYEAEMDKVRRWSDALTRLATLAGWDSRGRDEATLVEHIVQDISDKLICSPSSEACELVGVGSQVMKIDKILEDQENIHMIGIWGMGGIGKTTLAKVVYDKTYPRYESCCFLRNIKSKFKAHGIVNLQKELLSQLLQERNLDIWPLDDDDSNIIQDRLSCKKVLIVLDDVDNIAQLEALAGSPNWFGFGSTIIITTRDKHLLKVHQVDAIYEVKCLKDSDALTLFSKHAFKQYQIGKEFLKLAIEIIAYAKGLPLALKVVGSFLYGRSIFVWQDELHKLRSIPDAGVCDVLRTSFDALEDNEKQVFLDLAFFLDGLERDRAIDVLKSCRLFPDRAFAILVDQAFISISRNYITMHDMLQEMAKEIEHCGSTKPSKRRRLSKSDDVQYILTKKKGTELIKGICLNLSDVGNLVLEEDAFTGMDRLQFLKIYAPCYFYKDKVHLPIHGIQINSKELVYLHWDGYPSKSLSLKVCAQNITELLLPNNKIEKLWEGSQEFINLKRLNLSGSKYLTTTPDLSLAKNIVEIDLSYCTNLVEVHSSFGHLYQLKSLCLEGCPSLVTIPSRLNSKVLHEFYLTGCLKLRNCSNLMSKNLRVLYLSDTIIEQVPQVMCSTIKELWLNGTRIKRLHQSVALFHSMVTLQVGWTSIKELPPSIENLTALEVLGLVGCKELETLPTNLSSLRRLETIEMMGCKRIISIPELPPRLLRLWAQECESLQYFYPSTQNIRAFRALPYARVVFSFTRCIKLCEETRNNIVSFAQSKFRWAKVHDRMRFILPSTKIPRWFPKQAVGSSITIQVSLEFMTAPMLLCCVVAESTECSLLGYFRCRCQLKGDSNDPGHFADQVYDFSFPGNSSEQMVLCKFDKPKALQCALGDEILFDFVISDFYENAPSSLVKVNRCAIAFLHPQEDD